MLQFAMGYPTLFFTVGKHLQFDTLVEQLEVTWNLQVSSCNVTQIWGQQRSQWDFQTSYKEYLMVAEATNLGYKFLDVLSQKWVKARPAITPLKYITEHNWLNSEPLRNPFHFPLLWFTKMLRFPYIGIVISSHQEASVKLLTQPN